MTPCAEGTRDGDITIITKQFYSGGLKVAKMAASTVCYLHQDALESTRFETTSTVSIKFTSNYMPHGCNYALSGKEVFMYTGKPHDSATGLYCLGARFYDPTTGRFVTQDSHPGSVADPMTLNLYVYARDNPERYVDPGGHIFIDEGGYYCSPINVASLVASGQVALAPAVIPAGTTIISGTTTSSSGTMSYRSPDVTLTSGGNNQYANTPTIGLGGGGRRKRGRSSRSTRSRTRLLRPVF